MSQIIENPLGNTRKQILQLDNGAELDVLTGRGAGLIGWRLATDQGVVNLLDGYSSEADLQERYSSSHCGVRLTPFPNRLKDGRWIWQGQELQLPKNFPWENGHAIHGLLFDMPWTPKESLVQSDRVELLLECQYDGGLVGFPFSFVAQSRYILTSQGFEVQSSMTNTSASTMPFGEGWHPYFRPQCAMDEATLQMQPATLEVLIDDRSIPTGVLRPDDTYANPVRLGDRQINTCWMFAGPGERAEVTLANPSTGLTFRYWQDRVESRYQYIQLYIPPHRESLAIEPMTCPPDVLNNHMGEIQLAPGESHQMRFGVECAWVTK